MVRRTLATVTVGGMLLFLAPGLSGSEPASNAPEQPRIDKASAAEQFQAAHPRAGFYETAGRITRVYGRAFSGGADPVQSAEVFMQAHSAMFGVPGGQLVLGGPNAPDNRVMQPIMYNRDTGDYKFTGVQYSQVKDGIPVFRARAILLVRNDEGFPLVLVSADMRDLGGFEVAKINAQAGERAVFNAAGGLEIVSEPRTVIWAGVDDMVVEPKLAIEFIAEGGSVTEPATHEKWLFLVDAQTGAILYQEDQVLEVDVTGNVRGMATEYPGADICEPESLVPMPYSRVNIGATVAFADENGDFVIPNGGNSDVTVQSPVRGRWFRVFNEGGADTVLSQIVTPPGPADFIHNDPNTSEFQRAEVNGYVEANVVRDMVLEANPAYPTVANQTEFTVNVNINSSCNATYSGSAINFYRAQGGCANTAFSVVIHHEYGHHLAATGGSGQGQYGEGLGDCLGVIITDTSELAIGFQNNCNAGIRDADNNLQYPCAGAIHFCGQLISGCLWDTRNELVNTEPTTYTEILGDLMVNSVLVHTGSNITPQITIDWLVLDDDDNDIGNGTPHYNEIDVGFSAHNMDPPPISLLAFSFPNGLPDLIDPSGGTTFRVEVTAVAAEPQPGTGKLHYSAGGLGDFIEIDMVEIEPNIYDAVFPAIPCGDAVEFFVSALTTDDVQATAPGDGEAAPFVSISAFDIDVVFEDDFEADEGWTVVTTASTGDWERGVPAGGGDRGDPPTDADGSGQCYVTGLADGDNDIDGGSTTLTSPVLDATGDPFISYWRWYSNTFGADPENDIFVVEVNDGTGWTNLETVGPSGPEVNGEWFQKEFRVSDFVTPNNQFQIRFIASDLAGGSVVEAGVDGVELSTVDCDAGAPCPWDLDEDGNVGVGDMLLLFAVWGPCPGLPGCPGDFDVDGNVGVGDMLAMFANWGPCP